MSARKYLTHQFFLTICQPRCLKNDGYSRQNFLYRPSWLKVTFVLYMIGYALFGTGCCRHDKESSFQIVDDTIVLRKHHIHTSNPERYQPSYNVEGVLMPKNYRSITSPYRGYELTFLVEKGDWVLAGQPVAKMKAHLPLNDARYRYFSTISLKIADAPSHHHPQTDTTIDSNKKISTLNNNISATHQMDDSSGSLADARSPSNDNNMPSNVSRTIHNSHVQNLEFMGTDNKSDTSKNNVNDTLKTDSPIPTQAPTQNQSVLSTSSRSIPNNSIDADGTVIVILTFHAPLTGEVVYIPDGLRRQGGNTPKNISLMMIGNTNTLQLVGHLPLSAQDNLSIGKSVTFTMANEQDNPNPSAKSYSGQISKIAHQPSTANNLTPTLLIEAPVLLSDSQNKQTLKTGMPTRMTIDYGQMELGVRVPRHAIFEANLSQLDEKHVRPVSPIKGFVWVIKQNERLEYTPVEVVQYFPDIDQFLVNGISNDSLICLADLPKNAHGKEVVLD